MVDRIEKALRKLSDKEQAVIRAVFVQIIKSDFSNLDIQKLAGRRDVFRVRKGNIRILFRNTEQGIMILAVERRSDTTYR